MEQPLRVGIGLPTADPGSPLFLLLPQPGFGAAALSLTPSFKVAPATDKDGKPKEAVTRLAFNFTPK